MHPIHLPLLFRDGQQDTLLVKHGADLVCQVGQRSHGWFGIGSVGPNSSAGLNDDTAVVVEIGSLVPQKLGATKLQGEGSQCQS